MTHFLHAGDFGDIIYSLPVIRAMGGGVLHLRPGPGTTQPMTLERYHNIAALLAAQPYVHGVNFGQCGIVQPDGWIVDLDIWRSKPERHRTFLPHVNLDAFNLPRSHADEPWLTVPSLPLFPFVINRTARYHNDRFPWDTVLRKYDATFMGAVEEQVEFERQFGIVPYLKRSSLIYAAQIIAGCDLFIGNQSCPLAIAHAMKKPCVVEVYPDEPNCIDPRPDCIAGWDEDVELP